MIDRFAAPLFTAGVFLIASFATGQAVALTDASSATPVAATPLPQAVPVALGNVPLQNPAPVPRGAPANSASITNVSLPVVVPASNPAQAPTLLTPKRVQTGCSLRDYGAPVARGQLAAAVYNTCSGFSLHKPMILLPFTYSPRFDGRESEVLFQISGKAQLWDYGPGALYFAYSQKSYFQVYNSDDSKPFRENNFNPEFFTRIPKPFGFIPNWSFDFGLEHESNGRDLPDSRSYNRLYFQPYWSRGREVWQLKAWYRLPEDDNRAADDPKRDDNPDLSLYTGYTELRYRRDFPWRNSLIDVMVRGNVNTGRGAVQADYSFELGPVGSLFVRVFNGYAESLIDYNRSVTRVGVGVALQR